MLIHKPFRMEIQSLILTVFRLFLSIVFITSFLGKASGPHRFAATIASFNLIPLSWDQPVAVMLIVVEAIIAFLLFIGWQSQILAGFCVLLFAIFIIAVGINLMRGQRDLECGCFGPKHSQKIGLKLIGRQFGLVIIAFCVFIWGGGLLSWDNREFPGQELLTIEKGLPITFLFVGLILLFRLTRQLYYLLILNSLEE